MNETNWAQPNPSDLTDPARPPLADEEPLFTKPLPDTEVVLSELGAFYPIVAHAETHESFDREEQFDRSIYAGLVSP
jgi:hypothetical protein